MPRPALPAKPGGFPRLLRPEEPGLETKDWKELLWSSSHFAVSCGGGRTRYCTSILGSRKPRFNFSRTASGIRDASCLVHMATQLRIHS